MMKEKCIGLFFHTVSQLLSITLIPTKEWPKASTFEAHL